VDEYVLMMEAESSFERSGHIFQTKRRPVPEDSLHSHACENLMSHQCCSLFNNSPLPLSLPPPAPPTRAQMFGYIL